MDLNSLQALLTTQGQAALLAATQLSPTEETFLAALTQLQKQYPAPLAKAALETLIFRRKAQSKFTRAESMYFTREGLEMASSEIISRYRAQRFTPFNRIADLCCGLGGDSIALASSSPSGGLVGLDLDPLQLALATQNLLAHGSTATFIQSDLTQTPPPAAEAYFFDPGRRAAGKRLFSVRHYRPPLSLIDSWLPVPLGIKISPGVQLNEIAHYDCEIEFISLEGELKECVLWFGPLKTPGLTRRATLLTSSPFHRFTFAPAHPVTLARLSLPKTYLYEPDPAILRAGLVADLAQQLNAAQLDPDIAYLTADTLTPTPFATAFAIEAQLPFSQKRLREKLRALNVGRVTVKKRGSPLDVAALARSLKLKGDEERIIFLTQVNDQPWVLIGKSLKY